MVRELIGDRSLRVSLQQTRALIGEKSNDHRLSIAALQALLQMEPIDPSSIHYRLAVAFEACEEWKRARQEVLYALEETPRYREALELLVRLASEPRPRRLHLDPIEDDVFANMVGLRSDCDVERPIRLGS